MLACLIEADDDERVLACTLYARSGMHADPVYIHAKIAIIDDEWFTLGSANLNEHSLFNDTEMNIVTHDPELARDTRLRLWAEHLELQADDIPEDPARAVDELWKPIARSSSTGVPPASRSPTGSCASNTSPAAQAVSSARLTGILVDG